MRPSLRSLTILSSVTVLIFALVLPSFASFTLDSSFGTGGKLTIAFPDASTGYSSAGLRIFVQPSGRIIAAGSFTHRTADGQRAGIAVVGLTPGGLDDPAYTTTLDWQSNGSTSLSDALMYPDGRVLRLSRFLNHVASSTVRVSRTDVNGLADTVFESNASIGSPPGGFGTSTAAQVALRSDGKILVLITDNGEYLLYRLNADGTRDTSFGVNGVVGIRFNKIAFPPSTNFQMVALADGKVLLVGHVPPMQAVNGSGEFFVTRLTETGNWDKTFGRVGFLRVAFGPGLSGIVRNAVLQPDGKLLLCGSVTGSDTDVWMMRFRSNGRPDTTFGDNGVVISDLDAGGTDIARSMALSPDGKIRIAGSIGSPANFLIARYSSNGTFEESTSIPFTPGEVSSANDITIQPDGKLLVVGATKDPNPNTSGNMFALARIVETPK